MARSYKYTYGEGALTDDQRQFYEDNGYILIRNNISHQLLDEMKKRFIDVCEGRTSSGVLIVMKDPSLKNKGVKGEYLINKIQDWLFDDVLFKYAECKPIVDVIESIVGPDITAVHSMLINKPPDSNPQASLHPLHQDLHYFPFRPAERIAASWTAMEHVDEKNGCLFVVPGSHNLDVLYKHEYPKGYENKLYHGVHDKDHLPKLNVIMDKGDTVFFHPLLLHGSGPNTTKGFRKAISCHYANSNCHFIDVRGTTQENIATESEQIAQKLGFGQAKFEDIWKAKARLIRGQPGNFLPPSHL